MERLKADVAALAAMTRSSARAGERESAQWIAGRLRELGIEDVRVEPYRGRTTYAVAWIAYLLIGLLSRLTALGAFAALELDGSGRRPLLRVPAGEGANVVARIPASGPTRVATAPKEGPAGRRTVALVAHHDAANTGLSWHPALAATRRPHGRRQEGFAWTLAIPLVLRALGLRRAALLTALPQLALLADVARGATVPGANDNATGVAAVLALAEELPLEDADVLLVFPGCEESGMDGMRAFLREHRPDLVVSLDTLGSGRPVVLESEGVLLDHRYPDLLPDAEKRRLGGWTDPVLAVFAGIPAISILSLSEDGTIPNYHLPSDVPEHVDWDSVAACVDLARRALSAR